MPLSSECETRVRFDEVDSLGVVWHGHYVKYFEDGRADFGSKFGITYQDIVAAGCIAPIADFSCNHKLPLKYGDIVRICTTFIPRHSAKLTFEYKLYRVRDGELAATGSTTQVFLDRDKKPYAL